MKRKNRDVTFDIVLAKRPVSGEAFAVYERCLEGQHPLAQLAGDRESMEMMFYEERTDLDVTLLRARPKSLGPRSEVG